MKRWFNYVLALVVLVQLVGCTNTTSSTQETSTPEVDNTDYTTGTPWQNIDLDGVVREDTPTDVKDNFALYVNKEKILNTVIPEGYSYGGTVMEAKFNNDVDIKNMFVGGRAESHDAKLALDLYNLMMDWDTRNKVGVDPLKQAITKVEEIASLEDLSTYLGEVPVADQIHSLFNYGVTEDLVESDRMVVVVVAPKLLLGDSAEYSKLTEYGTMVKDAYTTLANKMLVKLGYTEEEAKQKIDNCLEYETMLAPSITTNEDRQKPTYLASSNNHYTRDELISATGNLPLLASLEKAFGLPKTDDYVLYQPKSIEQLNKLYTEDNLTLMKDYIIVHGAIDSAQYLDRECYEWYNDAKNAINGSTGILDDETAFSTSTASILEWPVGRLYTEKIGRAHV